MACSYFADIAYDKFPDYCYEWNEFACLSYLLTQIQQMTAIKKKAAGSNTRIREESLVARTRNASSPQPRPAAVFEKMQK